MEDNKNHNYDQDDRNYTDAPSTTDFEKSKLNDDPNQNYKRKIDQFEEFSGNTRNTYNNNDRNINSYNPEDENWKKEDNINDSSNSSHPVYNPDENYEEDKDNIDDPDLEPDIDDEDLDDESDADEAFDESDLDEKRDIYDYESEDVSDIDDDDDDDVDVADPNVADDWINRKN